MKGPVPIDTGVTPSNWKSGPDKGFGTLVLRSKSQRAKVIFQWLFSFCSKNPRGLFPASHYCKLFRAVNRKKFRFFSPPKKENRRIRQDLLSAEERRTPLSPSSLWFLLWNSLFSVPRQKTSTNSIKDPFFLIPFPKRFPYLLLLPASRLLRRKIPQSGHLFSSKRFWMQTVPNQVSQNRGYSQLIRHILTYKWLIRKPFQQIGQS